jgi:hypothetical protein
VRSYCGVSSDGQRAAFGISAPGESGRLGIRVIDLGTCHVVRDIEAGIAAEADGWIAPERLAAFRRRSASCSPSRWPAPRSR